MKTITLLKNKKDIVEKTVSIDYLFNSSNNRIDNIKINNSNDNIYILLNHYDNNNKLEIISLDYNIYNIYNGNRNVTDLYKYDQEQDILTLTGYTSDDTITFTDILYSNNIKYMLGRYHSGTTQIIVDGVQLATEPDFVSILTKTDTNMIWDKKIKHTSSQDATKGPVISSMIMDDDNNFYLFGNLTNRIGATDILNIDTHELINPIIHKLNNENITIITKTDNDGNVLLRKLIKGDSLFLNHKITYVNNQIILSFNFSGNIIIDNKTFSTTSNQIINSIIAKMDIDGNFIWIKQLKSEKYITNIDFTVDNDYVYCLGKFKGEAKFDDINLFYSGLESGYIMKMRLYDGLILNINNIYSDDMLKLNSITNDTQNIFISGAWCGNIYINGKIKNSSLSDFFITNIKKNEI